MKGVESVGREQTRRTLILVAIQYLAVKWGAVSPCSGKTWSECVTEHGGRLILWFNTPDNTTRIHYL